MKTIVGFFCPFFLFLFYTLGYGQQKVAGIVLDRNTKQRVARVLLINTTSGANVFNNARGEFSLGVQQGDTLIAQREEYKSDTLVYVGQEVMVFNLQKTSIYIEPVTVVAKKNPDEILAQRRIDYAKAYRMADAGDYFSVGPNGAGLSINTIFNFLSKEGKNARKLTAYFQQEYEENVVDWKFSRNLVKSVTGLEGELLDNFMIRYRPSYYFVQEANTYVLTAYIRSKYEQFKINPYFKPLPDLTKIKIDEK
ncbi:hypothetical protein G5B30_03505 [Sphingobacterium sp. SGG-5]|uniref:hypothetical protein n=1 Tax=Sphingobacterium sp. SGG-5 TaxID=2710881 RepID=UPI0013EBEA61|nr:hypothetical protein [Sphingobacterium sp. SGG-5]NGM60978.1 hypothetical protein [Sphingobacterium sp. SGG-5]